MRNEVEKDQIQITVSVRCSDKLKDSVIKGRLLEKIEDALSSLRNHRASVGFTKSHLSHDLNGDEESFKISLPGEV